MSDGPRVDIAGLDKAAVLAVLYNAAAPHRLGFLQYDPAPLTVEIARAVLAHREHDDQMMVQAQRMGINPGQEGWVWASHCFYYQKGRPLHVDIFGDGLDATNYDSKHGVGAAAEAIRTLRATGDVNDRAIRRAHLNRTVHQARIAWSELGEGWVGAHANCLRSVLEPILKLAGH